MRNLDTGRVGEERPRQMVDGTDADAAVIELARIAFGESDELLDAVRGYRRMHNDQQRQLGHERDWRKVPDRVVADCLRKCRIDDERARRSP
jgi:hypothetical protein